MKPILHPVAAVGHSFHLAFRLTFHLIFIWAFRRIFRRIFHWIFLPTSSIACKTSVGSLAGIVFVVASTANCIKAATTRPGAELQLLFPDFQLISAAKKLPAPVLDNLWYPGADNPVVAIYNPGYFPDGNEAMAILESEDQPQIIYDYYVKEIKKAGWQIIQSDERLDEMVLVAEDTYQRLLTIVLRSQNPTYIKLFIRPARLDW